MMSSIQVIRKSVLGNFTMIPNQIIQSGILKPAQLGYYTYLLSHGETWSLNVKSIATILGISSDTIVSYNKVLKANNLLRHIKQSTGQTTWVIYDDPAECLKDEKQGASPLKLPHSEKSVLGSENQKQGASPLKLPHPEKTLIRVFPDQEKPERINKTNSINKTNNSISQKQSENISLTDKNFIFDLFKDINPNNDSLEHIRGRFYKWVNSSKKSGYQPRDLATWQENFKVWLLNENKSSFKVRETTAKQSYAVTSNDVGNNDKVQLVINELNEAFVPSASWKLLSPVIQDQVIKTGLLTKDTKKLINSGGQRFK